MRAGYNGCPRATADRGESCTAVDRQESIIVGDGIEKRCSWNGYRDAAVGEVSGTQAVAFCIVGDAHVPAPDEVGHPAQGRLGDGGEVLGRPRDGHWGAIGPAYCDVSHINTSFVLGGGSLDGLGRGSPLFNVGLAGNHQ